MPEHDAPITDQTALGDGAGLAVSFESTIRERILLAVASKLTQIRTSKGYRTDCGSSVHKAIHSVAQEDTPCAVLWPGAEEISREYGKDLHVMEIRVEGLIAFGAANASDVSEKILGDIVDCVAGRKWTLPFTSGAVEISPGQTITGETSSATARVEAVEITSGSWDGGDAAGTLTVRRKSGDFASEALALSEQTAAQTTGVTTAVTAVTSTTDSLAEGIRQTAGGTSTFPQAGDLVVGTSATFEITYRTLAGNPYEQ